MTLRSQRSTESCGAGHVVREKCLAGSSCRAFRSARRRGPGDVVKELVDGSRDEAAPGGVAPRAGDVTDRSGERPVGRLTQDVAPRSNTAVGPAIASPTDRGRRPLAATTSAVPAAQPRRQAASRRGLGEKLGDVRQPSSHANALIDGRRPPPLVVVSITRSSRTLVTAHQRRQRHRGEMP